MLCFHLLNPSGIVYGGGTSTVEVNVQRVNTEYSITVAALLVGDVELNETKPVTVSTGNLEIL